MSEKLELSPEYWRKRAGEARTIAEMITDDLARETMFDIAQQYDELAEPARVVVGVIVRADCGGCHIEPRTNFEL